MMNGSKQSTSITLFSQFEPVATLVFNQPDQCSFHYDTQWIKNRFPISPHIPFNQHIESGTAIRFLRNLFPEGEAFDRLLESQNLSKNNLYAILKTIGNDTAGILSFFDTEFQAEKTVLRPIAEQELIDKLSTGLVEELVTWDGKYRLSVAGVQKKLNVYIDEEKQLLLADGDFSSTHILKFATPRYKHIVINELFCMRLAKATGMNVAGVNYKKFGKHDALIVERVDRKKTPKSVKKRHLIDACQALDLPPEYKYEHNFDIKTITAFDLLCFADETNISIPLLKQRLKKIIEVTLQELENLNFKDCNLSQDQDDNIVLLKALVGGRVDYLLKQSEQIDDIAKEAF